MLWSAAVSSLVMAAFLVPIGLVLLLQAVNYKVVLTDEAVTITNWFGRTKSVPYSQITRLREDRNNDFLAYWIERHDKRLAHIQGLSYSDTVEIVQFIHNRVFPDIEPIS